MKLVSAVMLVALVLAIALGPLGAQVTFSGEISLTNMFESDATDGREVPADEAFGLPAGAAFETATVGPGVEFTGFMDLWDIDVGPDTIVFTNIADPDLDRLGVSAPSTFDRYYFAFAEPVRTNFDTDDPFVLADQGEQGELVVVIEEGYDYRGPGFTVTPVGDAGGLPATGSSVRPLVGAAIGLIVIGFGTTMIASRRARARAVSHRW